MAGNREKQLQEITERLEQGVKDLFTSERYTEYLQTMSQFHSYSFNNTLLIAMQKPDATLVAGYQAWQKKFNRHVRKGEKGIQIIAPAPIREKEIQEKVDEQTGEVILKPNGQPETEEVVHVIPRFRVTTVFDLSQTDGEPLPDLGVEELTANVDNFDLFMQAIEQASPVPIRFDEISSGAKGYYDNGSKEIVIQQDMSESQTLKTAIHETAHARLHDRDRMQEEGIQKDQMTKEVEAESVAYTVCQSFGIDTSDYSFPYVAGWSSGKDMKELRSSMDTIRHTASEMMDEITEAVRKLQREQMQYTSVELFGTPALFDMGRIADEDIPDGLHRYDLRGSDNDPGIPVTVENHVVVNHAATVLTAYRLPIPERGFLRLGEELNFGSDGMISVQDYRQITAGLSSFDMEQRVQNAVIRSNEELVYSEKAYCYAIFQIDGQGDGRDYRFMNLDFVKKHGMDVKGSNYNLVYGGALQQQETLDSLYIKFNVGRPDDFTGHSLSVSDVILLNRGGEAKAWYVDSIGFTELPDFVQEREALLKQQSREVTEFTEEIDLDGHEGMWHTSDQIELMGETIYLMEHNEFGSDVAKVAVNGKGEVVAEDLWNGFDEGFHEAAAEHFAAKGMEYKRPEQAVTAQEAAVSAITEKGEEAEITETENSEPPRGEKSEEKEVLESTEDTAQGGNVPLYMENAAYAREHGELKQYRHSRNENLVCRRAIEQSISENFDGMHLKNGSVKPVIEQFGIERLTYILANTIQHKSWDRRFSTDNRTWAQTVPMMAENTDAFGYDRTAEWVVESHPAVLDGFIKMFRQEVLEQSREAEQVESAEKAAASKESLSEGERDEAPLTADEITNFKEISREYFPHMRTAEYVFSCDVRGEPDVLTYELSQHDDGESYSLHTQNHDIWDRMSRKELDKLEFAVGREVTFADWEKEIEQADSADALREVQYGMWEAENLNLSDEQRERLYQMIEEKEKIYAEPEKGETIEENDLEKTDTQEEQQIAPVALISDRTEPEVSLHGHSMADIEEMVVCFAQAQIDDMGMQNEVQIHGARVYGSRSREGLYTDASDVDVVLSYSGNIREDALFDILHESGLSISGIPVDINPISTEQTGTLEDYLKSAEQYLDEKSVVAVEQKADTAEQQATIHFYVAESMEFPVLGEYHENVGSLKEAIALYEQIPAERMNGIKGIGFTLDDGSMYAGMPCELMSAGIVSRDIAEDIPHFKESPLVQEALSELETVYQPPEKVEPIQNQQVVEKTETIPADSSKPTKQQKITEKPGMVPTEIGERRNQPENAAKVASRDADLRQEKPTGRKESVLKALRERQAKIKASEQNTQKTKNQKHKKGEQEL
ncbi:MAG: DUF3849 domain-containing protein [Lachnospiraceae bacterium]|nr:DUF3849 domain-containing protein [Lachnospiraceae bacterium]